MRISFPQRERLLGLAASWRAAAGAKIPERWRRPRLGVGVEVAAAGVRAVVMRRQGPQRRLLAAAHIPIADPAQRASVLDALRAAADAIRFPTLHAPIIATAVGGPGVVVRFATFPAMTAAELRQAIPFEAEKQIPYPLAEVVLECQALAPPRGGRQDVVFVAAKKDVVEERLQLLRDAGLAPHVIDVEPFALANAWELAAPPGSAVTALLVVDARRTLLDLVTGACLRLTREFPTGSAGGEVQAATPDVLDHLAQQLRFSVDYFENQSGQALERIAVTGPALRWPGFLEGLRGAVGQPVESWDPVAAVPAGPAMDPAAVAAVSADLAVAFGLSIRGAAA
ncbi:MAG: hypothetical protein A3C53_00965 [Omnitrophica WOR_2 bacterium RIFCSPHIGHO2_02_FULL_68_15]|nr:MAG: hypothetical protein A3C53_00965 [Omnitrophica WOR_2 bacterium RIFCSPHIGHO2_02_FULL_68_15]